MPGNCFRAPKGSHGVTSARGGIESAMPIYETFTQRRRAIDPSPGDSCKAAWMRTILSLCIATSLALIALHAQIPKPAGGAASAPNPVAGDPFVKNADATPADGAEGQWRNVVLVLEVYALPKDDALAILESERGSAARYQRVLDLAKTKKARLEILTALTTKSGNRAVTESVDEVRYATKFERGAAKGTPAVASTFEIRNVGDTLEFEPVIGPDGRTCDLALVPQRISLAGFRELAAAPGDSAVARPRFISQRLTTNTTLESDAPHYLGTLTPPSENGIADGAAAEIWLTFLRVHVHGPVAGEVKPPTKPFDWTAVNLEYSVYSLDRAQAREILIAMPTLEAPWDKLQGLLREKHAQFEHLVAIKTKSGQRASAQEDDELPYVNEYAGHADGTPGAPSEIATREVGLTLEVEPLIGPDGLTIDLSHVVNSVAHLGNIKTGHAPMFLDQPLFQTRKVTTNQSITAGRHMLVGTFNPPGANGVNERDDDGRTCLLFVRALPNEP